MPITDRPPGLQVPAVIRQAGAADLAAAMADARASMLRLFGAWQAALPMSMEIRYAPELNPPRWELGHIAWFEEYWLARNPQRLLGARADPDVARAAPLLPGADALYNSSQVAHSTRWHLDLPSADRTRDLLQRTRARTLALLDDAGTDDDALYFYRLALFHEDMHREAWVYMAQNLALDVAQGLDSDRPGPAAAQGQWSLDAARVRIGSGAEGFAFDNELCAHEVELKPFTIDRAPVRWCDYLPFVEAGGYDDERLWSREGWDWRQRHSDGRPRHLRQQDGAWSLARFGRWVELDPMAPAMHLSQHEAQAWCRWARRRLPTEAEWEHAAVTAAAQGQAFEWGQVWEWTTSPFQPYPGFEPHPYRDYSQPWFDGRPVLRGGSFATSDRIKHPRYRNYFTADRNDLFSGLRSCADD